MKLYWLYTVNSFNFQHVDSMLYDHVRLAAFFRRCANIFPAWMASLPSRKLARKPIINSDNLCLVRSE